MVVYLYDQATIIPRHGGSQQYNGFQNIPPQVIGQLPVGAQNLLKQQFVRQQQIRQQQAMRAQATQQQQQQQNGGGRTEQVPGSQPNPQYMQQLRDNQAMLAQAQQQMQNQQNQQGGMNNIGMQSFTMNGMGGNAFAGNQGQGGNDLSQQFAAMQNALNRSSSGPPGGQGGMQ